MLVFIIIITMKPLPYLLAKAVYCIGKTIFRKRSKEISISEKRDDADPKLKAISKLFHSEESHLQTSQVNPMIAIISIYASHRDKIMINLNVSRTFNFDVIIAHMLSILMINAVTAKTSMKIINTV